MTETRSQNSGKEKPEWMDELETIAEEQFGKPSRELTDEEMEKAKNISRNMTLGSTNPRDFAAALWYYAKSLGMDV